MDGSDASRHPQAGSSKSKENARAEEIALRFIGYRPRSMLEVRRRLARGGFATAVIEDTVARLEDWGYLDEEVFARLFAVSRRDTKNHAERRVRFDLLGRGVDRSIVDRVLDEVFADVDVTEMARVLAARRWARSEGKERHRRVRQVRDYLLRRGFEPGVVHRVLGEIDMRTTGNP
jgi:regulatory protein